MRIFLVNAAMFLIGAAACAAITSMGSIELERKTIAIQRFIIEGEEINMKNTCITLRRTHL